MEIDGWRHGATPLSSRQLLGDPEPEQVTLKDFLLNFLLVMVAVLAVAFAMTSWAATAFVAGSMGLVWLVGRGFVTMLEEENG